jgi:heme/copper-type cytochrome/quinol oxidase subunit 4
MKKNFNKSERFIRFILGLVLLVVILTVSIEDPLLKNIAIGMDIMLLLAAVMQFCPLYYFLGIDTYKSKNKPKMY